MMTRYESAKEIYAKYGVDTDAAIAKLKELPQSPQTCHIAHKSPFPGIVSLTGVPVQVDVEIAFVPFLYLVVGAMLPPRIHVAQHLGRLLFASEPAIVYFARYHFFL